MNESELSNESLDKPKPEAMTTEQALRTTDFAPSLAPTYNVGYTANRKRSVAVHFGDFKEADLSCPAKVRRMWEIAGKTITRQRKTIEYMRTIKKRLNKKLNTLQDLIVHLKTSKKISVDNYSILQDCIPSSQKQILLRQMKITKERKYAPELRTFALTLHFYSPNAYNYTRKVFGKCLPHPKTLTKWYKSVDGSPSYTSESLRALKVKAEEMDAEGKKLICSLMMDEMSIRKYIKWTGTKHQGYANYGFNLESDNLPAAKDPIVFLGTGWPELSLENTNSVLSN